jgi:hypothetical protein
MNDWKVMSVTQYVMPVNDNGPNQTSDEMNASPDEDPHGGDEKIQITMVDPPKAKPQQKTTFPVFHVTYWMFYPYSQASKFKTFQNLKPFEHLYFVC